jgi:hypothetical protein
VNYLRRFGADLPASATKCLIESAAFVNDEMEVILILLDLTLG